MFEKFRIVHLLKDKYYFSDVIAILAYSLVNFFVALFSIIYMCANNTRFTAVVIQIIQIFFLVYILKSVFRKNLSKELKSAFTIHNCINFFIVWYLYSFTNHLIFAYYMSSVVVNLIIWSKCMTVKKYLIISNIGLVLLGIDVFFRDAEIVGSNILINLVYLLLYHSVFLVVYSQVTAYNELLKHIEENALLDSLTEAKNVKAFNSDLDKSISYALEHGEMFTLVFMDLNDFKQINDNYGHSVGDDYLEKFAKCIKSSIRKNDDLYRVGGDEFVIIFRNSVITKTEFEKKISLARKLTDESESVDLSFSYGISVFNIESRDKKELLKIADHRMYYAKQQLKKGGRHKSMSGFIIMKNFLPILKNI